MIYGFIREHSNEFAVEKMCQVLGVSRSGYYSWLKRKPGSRKKTNDRLKEKIVYIYINKAVVLMAVPEFIDN